jgi:hypothetical protein
MAQSLANILTRTVQTAGGKAQSRGKMIGAVRAAANRLGLGDDDRKAIQKDLTGKSSLADMSIPEIAKVLERLNRNRPAPQGDRKWVAKVKALWWTCYWLGIIDQPNEAALTAFVRKQTGIATLRFLGHRDAPAVIEALKAMAVRGGVRWPSDAHHKDMAAQNPTLTMATLERWAVIDAIWALINAITPLYSPSAIQYLQTALNLGPRHFDWSAAELDSAIAMLGKKLRREQATAARKAAPPFTERESAR